MNTMAWQGFQTGKWTKEIDVRNFIQKNYTLYEGDDTFLEGVTDRTQKVWDKCHELILEEMKKGILDVETNIVSGIDNFAPGYIDQENEVIVGLQTDAPLKRIVNLYGGMKMAKSALEQYGYELNPQLEKDFHAYRKTHNEGVFDAYPKRTKVARHVGLLTGLPDAYGRGRVIGDYRRVALYGVDFLIGEKEKEQDKNLMNLPVLVVDDDKTCCESTVATLKEIGIMGEWVLSGREAVERCYARHELKDDYFAVILDWKMPEMDGIETARQIRKRIGKEITIIVLTSYEFSEIEEEAKAAGVDAFIAKPLFRSRLTATLRQFTSGRKEKTARNYLEELSESDYTGKRILLVEDNELNREIAVEILQMTGAEVETAENGKIAVEKVEASPKGSYDLVFMDIQMPVMNGYEATAAIRSLPGEKGKLPIVAMTANAFAEDVQLAKNTGMNGHIAKPLDMNKLNDVLESWL